MLTKTNFSLVYNFLVGKTLYAIVAVTMGISLWCRKSEEFCVRPYALHRQQPKDMQNFDFALPWKNFCGRPWLR